MKFSTLVKLAQVITITYGAYVPASPWSTLTPTGTVPASVSPIRSASGSFAISIVTLATANAKRAGETSVDADGIFGILSEIQETQNDGAPTTTGNTAVATENTAVTTENTAVTTENTAVTTENTAVTTRNTAVTTRNTAVTTRNTAATTRNTAVTTRNTAIDTVPNTIIKTTSKTNAIQTANIQSTSAQFFHETSTTSKTKTIPIQTTPITITSVKTQIIGTASGVNQIPDGQIQAQPNPSVLAQIGDGQVQQQTTVLAQIGDGQVQQQNAVNQIGDDQIQATQTAAAGVNQIGDGQIQNTNSLLDLNSESQESFQKTCLNANSLAITISNGELRDSKGRIGAIVANRQFQFDGPPPQAGTIYAGGWSIVPHSFNSGPSTGSTYGKLALGDQTTFYRCLSGNFYNLYDQSIGGQCSPVEFYVLEATNC